MYTFEILCCIGMGLASWCDEKECLVPRKLSYFYCIAAVGSWFFAGASMLGILTALLFTVLTGIFSIRGMIGRADVYMIFSVSLLLSIQKDATAMMTAQALCLTLAFASAGIRMIVTSRKEGCPMILHLFSAFLCSKLLI